MALPSALHRYFWDCDLASLTWQKYRDFIIRRLLQVGDMDAWQWLKRHLSDAELRNWIIENHARGLNDRQIRYWSAMLDIPDTLADAWVEAFHASLWGQR